MKLTNLLAAAAIALAAMPATAATNLILNGSFENGFASFTKTNMPTGAFGSADQAASIIDYNSGASYPTGAYGEAVAPDSNVSASPDAVGGHAAYFVGDYSTNEAISQLTRLSVGNYRIGFSYYLTQNGLNNVNNSSLNGTIIGVTVASTAITAASTAQTWLYASGVAHISATGYYDTSFVFNSNGFPSKDVVIDRVFAIATTDAATVLIPPTPTSYAPEPAAWALMIVGFGLTGMSMRRRKPVVVAA